MFIAYLLPAVLIICGMANRKSKSLYLVTLLYLFALIGFNTFSSDYMMNKWMYEEIYLSVWSNFEPGSLMIAKLCSSLGLGYEGYRCVVAGIFVIILFFALKKITKKVAIASIIAIIYPCVTFASGLRSAIAFSICIYSFNYIIGERKNKKKFIILTLLAVLFHYSAIFNLIYILWDKRFDSKKYVRIILLECMCFALLRMNVIYTLIASRFPNLKILEWINVGEKESPSVIAFLVYVAISFFIYWLVYNGAKFTDLEYRNNVKALIKLNILYFPLLAINFTYERALIFGNFMLFVYVIDKTQCNNRRWNINKSEFIVVLGAILLNLTSYLWINNNLYFPILINNRFFK